MKHLLFLLLLLLGTSIGVHAQKQQRITTVNLYEEAQVVEGGKVTGSWQVLGRRRKITV